MAFLDFFWKKAKQLADTTAQNTVTGINTLLTKHNGPFMEINYHLAEQNERLRRIENKQKETGLQLEGIDDFLQSNGGNNNLIDAFIDLVDIIGDFYFFAAADTSSPLFEQAQMMMNTAKSTAETAGLEIIDAVNEPYNFNYHDIHSIEQDYHIQNGFVIKTLKFGFLYNNEIIRRATVVMNKIDTTYVNEEGEESFS
jgi:molecular chaperone GrpE (heat shock protein)